MLFLTSCCTLCPEKERIVEVKIPIPVSCPAPPIFDEIADPVLKFTEELSIEQKIKDLRASRVLWRDRAKQQGVLLDAYRQNIELEKTHFKNYSGSK